MPYLEGARRRKGGAAVTLSRRDRAALTLAYECLRGGAQDPPRTGGSIYEADATLVPYAPRSS